MSAVLFNSAPCDIERGKHRGKSQTSHDDVCASPARLITIISLYREGSIHKRLRTARGALAKITPLMLPASPKVFGDLKI